MDVLWAPWRMQFVSKENKDTCIFCNMKDQSDDRENLLIKRGKVSMLMMNRYPYNNGHVMVAPYRHINDFDELTAGEIYEIFQMLKLAKYALDKVMHPHGYNMGLNEGEVAGAGFEHIHFHLVPRWTGDTNFMPVTASTKVMPELLLNTYDKIFEALQ
ncbi:MAG: HIT domain-containing protein [Nitrososphaerota archaeon]|nr:HIT domain-containing protein [Nitrososphaerota archaeon]MDG7042690.1 HIT domain-containing protein [Nitrososphaerota archaeon]MDG7045796.1 HIT domain-containing protein [Nitrososphaerota archaeon]MDG7047274.1 HIT domain-containing protein [Nitrososphaerota archaeon]